MAFFKDSLPYYAGAVRASWDKAVDKQWECSGVTANSCGQIKMPPSGGILGQ